MTEEPTKTSAVPAGATPTPAPPAKAIDDRVYRIKSTSRQSAEGEESLELTLRADDDKKLTKRLIDYKIIDNPSNKDAKVEVRFHHQRRGNATAPWAAAPTFKLSQLQAGTEATLELTTVETLALFQYLKDLYAVADQGIPSGQRAVRVVADSAVAALLQKGRGQDILSTLIAENGPEKFLELLRGLAPNLSSAAALAAIHQERLKALEEFEAQIKAGKWTEDDWYKFFKANQWIFGHGLSYKFLNEIKAQAYVGGQAADRKGAKLPDYLMETVAEIRFSVLVEVKRPETPLLDMKAPYRPNVFNLAEDLTGGVAQVQTYCDEWKTESNSRANRKIEAMTYEPKGILLIGNLAQFEGNDKDDMARSFELFRRSLHNPEVLTFDELLDRARFMVNSSLATKDQKAAVPAARKD